jgi:hypothetical protein
MIAEFLVGMQAETVSTKVFVVKEPRQVLGERPAVAFWPWIWLFQASETPSSL